MTIPNKGERLKMLTERARHELDSDQRLLWYSYCLGIMVECANNNERISHSDINLIERDLNNFTEDK